MQFAVSISESHPADAGAHFAKTNRGLFLAIAVLAVAGIVVSAVSLQRHYAKSASAFCDIGEKFNCDIVNRSEYSRVMGIPVAGMGWGRRIRGAADTGYALPNAAGDSNVAGGGGYRGISIRFIPDLCRRICVGHLVHFVFEFAGDDCGDYTVLAGVVKLKAVSLRS